MVYWRRLFQGRVFMIHLSRFLKSLCFAKQNAVWRKQKRRQPRTTNGCVFTFPIRTNRRWGHRTCLDVPIFTVQNVWCPLWTSGKKSSRVCLSHKSKSRPAYSYGFIIFRRVLALSSEELNNSDVESWKLKKSYILKFEVFAKVYQCFPLARLSNVEALWNLEITLQASIDKMTFHLIIFKMFG